MKQEISASTTSFLSAGHTGSSGVQLPSSERKPMEQRHKVTSFTETLYNLWPVYSDVDCSVSLALLLSHCS